MKQEHGSKKIFSVYMMSLGTEVKGLFQPVSVIWQFVPQDFFNEIIIIKTH